MTNSRHTTAPMRSRRSRSTADKIISAGLATATCVGIVGVIGIRSIEASAAADSTSASLDTSTAPAPVVSSAGLTEAQLDTYAAQLAAESAKLDAYRNKLTKIARTIQTGSTSKATTTSAVQTSVNKPAPAVKAAPKPVAKPAPKPVAKPAPAAQKTQSKTKSS